MLNSAEPEIFHAHKYKKYQEIQLFPNSDKPRTNANFPAHNCQNANNCWHFNIYELDKFHAQLS